MDSRNRELKTCDRLLMKKEIILREGPSTCWVIRGAALTFAPKTTEELDFATEGKGTGAKDAGCKDGAQPPWRFDCRTLEAAIGDAEH